jgi:hypothetical protein
MPAADFRKARRRTSSSSARVRRLAGPQQIETLEWCLSPHFDESANGLLGRLAALHGFRFTSVFRALVGLPRARSPVQQRSFTEAVAALNGCDPTKLAASTLEAREEGLFLGSQCISKDLHGHVRAGGRVCPQCLREDRVRGQFPYRRVLWDLSMFSICPSHGSELISSCPDCGMLLSFDLASPLFCLCGFDLRRCEEYRATEADRKGERHLADLLIKKGQRSPGLAGASCDRTAQILATLGRFSTTQDARGSWRRMPAPVRTRWVSAGITVFEDWPRAYHQMLDGLLATGKASRSGPNQYGPFYHWLNAQPADCEALREEFTSHALANVPFGPASRLFGKPQTGSEHVTLGYLIENKARGSRYHGVQAARQLGFLPPGAKSRRIKLNQTEARSLVTRLKEIQTEPGRSKDAKGVVRRRHRGRRSNSVRTVSAKLGMHLRDGSRFLGGLADSGLIAVIRPGHNRCWYIADDQVDLIQRSFVSLSQIARAEPAKPRHQVRAALEQYGIEPLVALPRNDAAYRASDFPPEWNIAGMKSAEQVSRRLFGEGSDGRRRAQRLNCAHSPAGNVSNAHGLRSIAHKNTGGESGGR